MEKLGWPSLTLCGTVMRTHLILDVRNVIADAKFGVRETENQSFISNTSD